MADPRPIQSASDPSLEQEMQAALGGLSDQDLLNLPASRVPASRLKPDRQNRTGTVIRIQGEDVMVEFGPKSQGVCPLRQFKEAPQAGDQVEFVVERLDAFEGLLILALPGATTKAPWEHLTEGQVVEARCIGMNKGGLDMEVSHHRAFMPAGQVDIRPVEDISIFLGEKFPCMIIELRKDKGRMVLSRKAALARERAGMREKTLAELAPGQIRDVTISSVQAFGAFADLGGVDGLIHVSDLSHERIKDPSEVVKVGDLVKVKVLRVDLGQKPPKISLSRKEVMQDPMAGKLEAIAVGESVTGRVTKLAEFGAFVEVAPGVEGLVHISEVSHDRIPSVDRVLKVDQVVTAKVLSVDPARRRLSLSIKALLDRPAAPAGRGGKDGGMTMPARPDDPAMAKLRAKFSASRQLKGGLG
ncbi:MAG: S1 RNA-binding domain-containing protein [Planctomycetes bacterium]|nr:S1 RNA-binding domain-containing protein [Planctomycetota bacterium]